jgi:DNA-binding transcriptional ArsR family regulator
MVEDSVEMDAVFRALASVPRRQMLRRLTLQDLTVGELAEPLDMSLAAASKHVKVLERVGLVEQTVVGREHICHLEAKPMSAAAAWLQFYECHWTNSLDALDSLLESDASPSKEKP